MIKKWALVCGLLINLLSFSAFSQPFPCDGSLLISHNKEAAPHQIHKVIFGPFGTLFYSPLKIYQGGYFDAVGFNPLDNYIYGVLQNSNEIVRLRADQSFEVIGQVPSVPVLNASAGDCTPEGNYICIDNEADQLLVFDVVTDFALTRRIDLFWDTSSDFSGPFTAQLGDFAIDPTNPTVAYAHQGNYFNTDLQPAATRGFLHRINLNLSDPEVGMVTPIALLSLPEVRKIGSLMFTAGGVLYGYGSINPGAILDQNNLISINKSNAESFYYQPSGPTAFISDGCSCPYTLTFECTASLPDVLCTDSEISYSLIINNRFYQDINGVTLIDTLPDGMIIEQVTGNFTGDIAPGTGSGTPFLQINNLQIPGRGVVEIIIQAQVNDIAIDFVDNQAFLSNLPERFGYDLASDDPGTSGAVGDATTIIGTAQTLSNFAIDITQPTNCLTPDDAIIRFSSTVLIAGQEYEVKLRNENWDIYSWDIDIDNNNSFVLENMSPGEYTVFQITPQNTNCSFEMRDTTIDIIPPNDQLSATASSNSPICENSTLALSAEISPAGSVEWSGPIYLATGLNATIPMATPDNGGTYEMLATYGACEQLRTLEVEVAPDIQAEIIGAASYCEREFMQLSAKGEGELESFQWSAPSGIIGFDSVLTVTSMAPENAGRYQLVMDNGICLDTSNLEIEILPSPTITLPDTIKTDLCQSVKLQPLITGDNNVTYSWTPEIGLSCFDCPSPELLLPMQRNFKLSVINDYLCADTASVRMILDKDKLIYIPNAISPNRDGRNDYLQLFPGCAVWSIKQMDIFNRWGVKVFSKGPVNPDNHGEFWEGGVAEKISQDGVYLYRVELELKDGTTKVIFGNVTILR